MDKAERDAREIWKQIPGATAEAHSVTIIAAALRQRDEEIANLQAKLRAVCGPEPVDPVTEATARAEVQRLSSIVPEKTPGKFEAFIQQTRNLLALLIKMQDHYKAMYLLEQAWAQEWLTERDQAREEIARLEAQAKSTEHMVRALGESIKALQDREDRLRRARAGNKGGSDG